MIRYQLFAENGFSHAAFEGDTFVAGFFTHRDMLDVSEALSGKPVLHRRTFRVVKGVNGYEVRSRDRPLVIGPHRMGVITLTVCKCPSEEWANLIAKEMNK